MEKELLCPVCQEMYKQPLVLPCTHNVCQACAREVLGQQGYVGHGGDPSSEPTSPASTPSTRSPRLSRRTLPKPDRLDRLLKSGGAGTCGVGGGDAGMSIRKMEGVHHWPRAFVCFSGGGDTAHPGSNESCALAQ